MRFSSTWPRRQTLHVVKFRVHPDGGAGFLPAPPSQPALKSTRDRIDISEPRSPASVAISVVATPGQVRSAALRWPSPSIR